VVVCLNDLIKLLLLRMVDIPYCFSYIAHIYSMK